MSRDPHTPYIDAVVDALAAAGRNPTDWWADDTECGSDGETMTLTAVLNWDGEVRPDDYPHGILLCWSLELGWQWAVNLADGSNRMPADLPIPLWAAPSAVVASVAALLDGGDPPASVEAWLDDEVMAAVKQWESL